MSFMGPQIKAILKDKELETKFYILEKRAWVSFKSVSNDFQGLDKSEDQQEILNKLISGFEKVNCNKSIKLHFRHLHVDVFPSNLGEVNGEHGKRFYQYIVIMQERYPEKLNVTVLA